MSRRTRPLNTAQTIDALFSNPALYAVADAVGDRDLPGRPTAHPTYLLLGMAALGRAFRSINRVESELADPTT